MRVNENEMRMRWNNKAWSVLESGLRIYQSWDSSWCSSGKPNLKLRGIPAASTISRTCALRTIVIVFSQKEWQGPARASLRPGPARPAGAFRLGQGSRPQDLQVLSKCSQRRSPLDSHSLRAFYLLIYSNFKQSLPVAIAVALGRQISQFIVGGSNANIANHPHQLSLRTSSHICGASLMSATRAVTAAHCIGGAALVGHTTRDMINCV